MSKILIEEQLIDYLDNNIAWRKKEIANLYLNIDNVNKEIEKESLFRSSVLIYYAHFEGFIKEASTKYLEFVSNTGKPLHCYTNNFRALSLYRKIKDCTDSKRKIHHVELINYIDDKDLIIRIPYKHAISTESNLKSVVLKEILYCLNFSWIEYWEGKSLFIDGKLLFLRNKIAHGEKMNIDEDSFSDLHNFVIEALEYFKFQIEEAVIYQKYLKTAI